MEWEIHIGDHHQLFILSPDTDLLLHFLISENVESLKAIAHVIISKMHGVVVIPKVSRVLPIGITVYFIIAFSHLTNQLNIRGLIVCSI